MQELAFEMIILKGKKIKPLPIFEINAIIYWPIFMKLSQLLQLRTN